MASDADVAANLEQRRINNAIADASNLSDEQYDAALDEFVIPYENAANYLVIDWREEDDKVVAACRNALLDGSQAELKFTSVENDDHCSATGILKYGDRSLEIEIPFSHKSRYILLRAVNQILSPDYEIRLIRHSLGGDTHEFMLFSRQQWSEIQKTSEQLVNGLFVPLTEPVDFE